MYSNVVLVLCKCTLLLLCVLQLCLCVREGFQHQDKLTVERCCRSRLYVSGGGVVQVRVVVAVCVVVVSVCTCWLSASGHTQS